MWGYILYMYIYIYIYTKYILCVYIYYIILYYIILYSIILYYYIILFYIILYYIILHYIILYYIIYINYIYIITLNYSNITTSIFWLKAPLLVSWLTDLGARLQFRSPVDERGQLRSQVQARRCSWVLASLAEVQHGLDALALGTVVFDRFGFFKFGADYFLHNVSAHDSIHKCRLFKKSEMSYLQRFGITCL